MNLEITVDSVIIPQKNLFVITFRMILSDGVAPDGGPLEVLNTIHSVKYRPGDDVGDHHADLIGAFQSDINNYKLADQLKSSQGMTNTVAAIKNGLVI